MQLRLQHLGDLVELRGYLVHLSLLVVPLLIVLLQILELALLGTDENFRL